MQVVHAVTANMNVCWTAEMLFFGHPTQCSSVVLRSPIEHCAHPKSGAIGLSTVGMRDTLSFRCVEAASSLMMGREGRAKTGASSQEIDANPADEAGRSAPTDDMRLGRTMDEQSNADHGE